MTRVVQYAEYNIAVVRQCDCTGHWHLRVQSERRIVYFYNFICDLVERKQLERL